MCVTIVIFKGPSLYQLSFFTMLITDDPSSESNEDSMSSLIAGEGYDMADMEPYVHEDQERRWTNLVVAEVATYFHGKMAAVLGTWASVVYSRSSLQGVGKNYAADYISRRMMFPAPGLVWQA